MFLRLVAIDQLGEERNFTCELEQLEDGFDLLNHIVAKGHTLLEASIVDHHQSTSLPVEVFEGVSFLAAMQELQQEWESLLIQPTPALSFTQQQRIQWLEQRVQHFTRRIADIERLSAHFRGLIQRADNFYSFVDKTPGASNHFQLILDKNEVQLIKLRLVYHLTLARLNAAKRK